MGELMRNRALAAVAAVLLCAISWGCDRLRSGRGAEEADGGAPSQTTEKPRLREEPAAGPTQPAIWIEPSERPSGDEALEVIRKRLADTEASGAAVAVATPTPEPKVELQAGEDDVIWARRLGLMWTLEAAGVFAVEDAAAHCEGLSLAGHSDWRPPTITELGEVMTSAFSLAPRSRVRTLWSGSRHPVRGTWAWDVGAGSPAPLDAGVAHIVCVRDLD